MTKISQREARRLRQQVVRLQNQLDNQNRRWIQEWPSSKHLATLSVGDAVFAAANTARKLGHAVVVSTASGGNKIDLYASLLETK